MCVDKKKVAKLIRHSVSEVGATHLALLQARAPPRALLARLLRLESETLGLHDVEEKLPNEIARARLASSQTRSESGERSPTPRVEIARRTGKTEKNRQQSA